MFDGAPVPGPLYPVARMPGERAEYAYTPELGREIAEWLADDPDGGLRGLHSMAPDRIPPPLVVRAWARQYPAFGLLLRDAERARAELVMEKTVVIADTGTETPARLALRIATRQKLAGSLDAARYGNAPEAPASGAALTHAEQPVAVELTDAQLAQLAIAGAAESVG